MKKYFKNFIDYLKIKNLENKAFKCELSEYDKNLVHLSLAYEYLIIGAKKDFKRQVDQIYLNFFNGILDNFYKKDGHMVVLIVVLEELINIKKFSNNMYIKDIISSIKENPMKYVVTESAFSEEYRKAYRNLFLDEYLLKNNILIIEK